MNPKNKSHLFSPTRSTGTDKNNQRIIYVQDTNPETLGILFFIFYFLCCTILLRLQVSCAVYLCLLESICSPYNLQGKKNRQKVDWSRHYSLFPLDSYLYHRLNQMCEVEMLIISF